VNTGLANYCNRASVSWLMRHLTFPECIRQADYEHLQAVIIGCRQLFSHTLQRRIGL